jgi:hypothetical protein
MPSEHTPFWQVKWDIRRALLARFKPDRLRPVEISEDAVRKFLVGFVTTEAPGTDPILIDFLVPELIKEFYSDRPLLKASILKVPPQGELL